MTRHFFHILFVSFLFTVLIACQKQISSLEEEEETEQPEEIIQQLPKQIVLKHFTDSYIEVWSMQYDTANRRINVYYDDTTNANPYDVLKASYQYNADGYLIKVIESDGTDEETSVISRDANNRIRYITNHDEYFENTDTSFYNYENISDSVRVSIERRAYLDQDVEKSNYAYTYKNKSLQTLRLNFSDFLYNYQYQQNKLTNMEWVSNGDFIRVAMIYQTPAPDETRDLFQELILGKDYYIQDIRDMYFFFLFRDSKFLTVSASDPHHLAKFSFTYKNEDEEGGFRIVCTYEFNQKGKPVSIFMESEEYTAQYLIRY
jgi:hypothetical protein